MNQSIIFSRLKILPAMLLLCLGAVAQQQQATPAKQDLALEVDRGEYPPMEIPAFNGAHAEAAAFRRIKSWKPATRGGTVESIIFKIGREDHIVIARVSVRLENDKEVLVGIYRLSENETIRTDQLTKFGLEPLVLKVVRAKVPFKDPVPPIMPKVENKTQAVEVVGFYQEALPIETFRLTLRNVSNKNIIAVDLFMPSADGNGGGGQRSLGNKAHPVMRPEGISVHHIGISRGGRMTPNGLVPDVPVQQTLIVRTVVFEDGTHEGLAEPAAEIEAQRRGLDMQRRRILRLLQTQKTNNEDLFNLNELKEQAYALDKTADPSVVVELIALFPSLDEKSKVGLQQMVEGGLRDGKLELLRHINDFEELQKQPGEHIKFGEWIKETKANYEKLTTL